MKKTTSYLCIIAISSFVFGCASSRTNPNVTSYQPPVVKQVFIGWDENGHKKFSNSTTKDVNQKIEFNLSSDHKDKTVLLNEDAIICEAEDLLIPPISEGVIENDVVTGTLLNISAKRLVQIGDSDKALLSSSQNYLNTVDSLSKSGSINGSSYQSSARNRVLENTNKANQSQSKSERAASFLRFCKATGNPQQVKIVEIKPISKTAKIKVNISGSDYELWTYQNHLTVK